MLIKTTTGYVKTPYNMGDCYLLEQYLSTYDEEKDQYVPYGYIVHDNALYIPNINMERFMKPLQETEVVQRKPNPVKKMSVHHMGKFQPRDQMQQNVIDFLTSDGMFNQNKPLHQLGIVANPGFGKGLPVSTKIPTPNGFKLMGDLQVGDEVFAEDGSITKVTDIFEQGIEDVYKITFSDGRVSYCDENHLWKVYVRGMNGTLVPKVIRLKEILPTYKIPRHTNNPNQDPYKYIYYVRKNDPVEYYPRSLPVDPWVLGCFIGNGCCSEQALAISCPNDEIPNRIAEKYGFIAKKNPCNDTYYFSYGENKPRVLTADFFKDIPEVCCKKSYEKSIPDAYMYSSISDRIHLLQGLMDTDGSITYDDNGFHVMYSSTSSKLCNQIQYILWSLGFSSTIHVDKRSDKYTTGFCANVMFNVPNESKNIFFSVSHKLPLAMDAAHAPQQDRYRMITIKDIQLDHQEECRCIKVSHPSHMFLTENFIPTHNTFTSIYSVSKLCVKTLVVTHMTKIEDQWIASMMNMFDYHADQIMRLNVKTMTQAMDGTDFGKDVYFVNHQILNRWMLDHDPTRLNDVFKNLGIGIKIIDEYHLHWRNSIILDLFTNIDKTIYLTATFGRSNKEEDKLFEKITDNVVTYGSSDKSIDERHTEYHPIIFNSKCPFRTIRAMGNGHGMGMKKNVYADWEHIHAPDTPINTYIIDLVGRSLQSEGRILVTVASIKCCDVVAQLIQKNFPDESVGVINSSYSAKQNEEVKQHAKIIVSTIQSSGTGVDIKKLRYLINAEPFASKITAKQFIGRLRPYYDDKGEQRTTYLFDLVDKGILYCNVYYKSRTKVISELSKEVSVLEY